MENIYRKLLIELKNKKPLVLATIISAKGSTPQIPGASAIFSAEGLIEGTVGGGILEGDAQKKSQQALKDGISRAYSFILDKGDSKEDGAVCGGKVHVLLDAQPEQHSETFTSICNDVTARKAGVLVTIIDETGKEKVSLSRFWIREEMDPSVFRVKELVVLKDRLKKTLSRGKPVLFPMDKNRIFFLEPMFPRLRLIIAGAGHIGQAVSHLGHLLDFEVTVIDDRPEYANKERLPDADHIIVDDIEKAVRDIPKSLDSYVVIVTRGHLHDESALRQCITSDAAYIGVIGSRNKINHVRRVALKEGWATQEQLNKIHAPIGIEIQSKTVEEIALSIAAQLVLVRNKLKNESQ